MNALYDNKLNKFLCPFCKEPLKHYYNPPADYLFCEYCGEEYDTETGEDITEEDNDVVIN